MFEADYCINTQEFDQLKHSNIELQTVLTMKFIVIFAAVVLTINAAKVPPMSEETVFNVQVPPTIQPVEEIAIVSEIPNDQHFVSTEVTPIVSTTVTESVVPLDNVGVQIVQVDAVKVPLTQNPQVPLTILTPNFSDNNAMKPLVETPMLAELSDAIVTTVSPVDSTEVTTIVTDEDETKKLNDPSRCDLQCTKLDLDPVCAINLDCIHEFPNHCVMETYNCLHPNKAFKEVKDQRCKMHWLKKCTEKEMMED